MNHTEINTDPRRLVAELAAGPSRDAAFRQLLELGSSARDAVVEGLGDGRWQVRRLCAAWIARRGDPRDVAVLAPLLRDQRSRVRMVAVTAIGRDRGQGREELDRAVPLLVERIREDPSIRVRRCATALLAFDHRHPHLEGLFRQLLDTERDPKLHRLAGIGWTLCRSGAGGRTC